MGKRSAVTQYRELKPTGASAPVHSGGYMADISDALPPPTKCDECNSTRVRLLRSTKRKRAKYVCRKCKASVYCHKGTNIPLGYTANGHTRYLRAKAHEAFDPLWLHGLMTRDAAYKWLARQTGNTLEQAHIGRLSDTDLERLTAKSVRHYRKLAAKAKRREATQNATDRRQRTRTRRGGGKWKPRPPSGTG